MKKLSYILYNLLFFYIIINIKNVISEQNIKIIKNNNNKENKKFNNKKFILIEKMNFRNSFQPIKNKINSSIISLYSNLHTNSTINNNNSTSNNYPQSADLPISPLSFYNHTLLISIKQINLNILEKEIYERSSPLNNKYQKWLTSEEIKNLTSNINSYYIIKEWLEKNNLSIIWSSNNNDYIKARGNIKNIEKLLKTKFYYYEDKTIKLNNNEKNILKLIKKLKKLQDIKKDSNKYIDNIKKLHLLENEFYYNSNKYYIRAPYYYLPEDMSLHIQSIFNTVQVPPEFNNYKIILTEEENNQRIKEILYNKKIIKNIKVNKNNNIFSKLYKLYNNIISNSFNNNLLNFNLINSLDYFDLIREELSLSKEIKSFHSNKLKLQRYGITVDILKQYYQIQNDFLLTNSSQSVFQTSSQYYSPRDMLTFFNYFNIVPHRYSNSGDIILTYESKDMMEYIKDPDNRTTKTCKSSDEILYTNRNHNFNDNNFLKNKNFNNDFDNIIKDNPPNIEKKSIDCVEGNLDLQYLMGLAPGVNTYFSYSPGGGEELIDPFLDWILNMASMKDEDRPKVTSISWGAIEQVILLFFFCLINIF